MKAKELFDSGALAQAIDQLGAELRAQPTDLRRRTFLFELLCFSGDLARAGRQLDAIEHQGEGPGVQVGAQVYRTLLASETSRAELFGRGLRPRFLLEPPPAVGLHLEALEWLRQGRPDEARAALDRAAEMGSPGPRGRAAGVAFDDFRDGDDVLAPVLEVFAPGGYFWVPWEQVQFLEVPPPRSLRDLLWAPAKLAAFDGQLGEVFLPALYPGSGAHADDQVRLGRKTEWQDVGGGIVRGAGRKLFLVGDEDRSILELGEVQFEPPADAAGSKAGEAEGA